jgi:hypothetical protein
MAVSLQVLKLTPIHAVVKVYGTNGSQTISLATTLKLANETVAAPVVDIKAIWWSCAGASGNTITRNGKLLWEFGTIPGHFQFDGWTENEEHTSDIVVALPAAGGTIVLELVKKGGYGDEQFTPIF